MSLQLSLNKKKVQSFHDKLSSKRSKYIKRNKYYYRDLINFLKYNVPSGKKILEVGCGTGYVLNALEPSVGVGIDISSKMLDEAKKNYPNLNFHQQDAEDINLEETFDVIIISDTLGYIEDIQAVFKSLKKVCNADTRIIITYHNFVWQPVLSIAEFLRLKMPQQRLNWLNRDDVTNLLEIEGFDIVKNGRRLLFPKFFPILSWLFNKYLVHLPIFNLFAVYGHTIARSKTECAVNSTSLASLIIPARNEEGNIERAIQSVVDLKGNYEIVFVEGNSTDNTFEQIKLMVEKYKDQIPMQFTQQEGKGKGDAVRKGFAMAKGEILMILDGDLTVDPSEIPKFYNAITENKGEYINGCRLVYPMEKEAMRFLNLLGNKFFSLAFSWLIGQRLKDTLCGTKVMTKDNWNKLVANRSYFGDFDPFGDFDIIFGASKLNLKIVEVPIRYRARSYGDTNISRFSHGWLLLKMVFFALNKINFK